VPMPCALSVWVGRVREEIAETMQEVGGYLGVNGRK
jgi:hypothetical protein